MGKTWGTGLSGTGLFIALIALLTAQAAWRGGAPERLASAAMLAATVATMLSNAAMVHAFRKVEWPLLWIDIGLLAALVLIALFADRFWPIWIAALQGLTVAGHAARAVDPQILPYAYWLMLGKISYPMIALLAIAIERHQWRKQQGYPEAAWSIPARHADRPGDDDVESSSITIRIRTQGGDTPGLLSRQFGPGQREQHHGRRS